MSTRSASGRHGFQVFGLIVVLCSLTSPLAVAAEYGVRIRFGLEDKQATKWDGAVEVSEGKVTNISGWRFTNGDIVEGKRGWKASTRPVAQTGRGNNQAKAAARNNNNKGPISDNGVVVSFADVTEKSKVTVKTAQGEFDFTLGELEYGDVVERLSGAVEIERTGTARQLTTGRTDDDFPSIAVAPDGTAYVAYVSFTPGRNRDDYNRLEEDKPNAAFTTGRTWAKSPEDMAFLAKPVGGDQVWLRVREGQKWSAPIAVTEAGGDIYKCNVAVDGSGKAWITCASNANWGKQPTPNFDIAIYCYDGKEVTKPVALSSNEASDVNPVIAADSKGRIWAAWQGVRNGVFQILERHQTDGGAWSEERVVSTQTRSCWTPAIAASSDGRVAIAWDTYDKGDYDVWLREYQAAGGKANNARPVANTVDYEARPSLTYDTSGALWIGYELGTPTWGKNYGALVTTQGTPLYRGRQIGLIVWKEGKWLDAADNFIASLPGAKPRKKVNNQRVPAIEPQGESKQQAVRAELLRDLAYNNVARVATDGAGNIWLFCRSRQNDFRFPILGSLWLSWAAYYDGEKWTGPILIPNSDNLMYNLPAVAALPKGGLLVAHSTDHRQDRFPVRDPKTDAGPDEAWTVPGDPFDNDVYLCNLRVANKPTLPLALQPAKYPPSESTAPSEATVAERAAIARCQAQQIEVAGRKLKLIRGEFHRHTEISGDGGNDGPLEDMWRYAMDVANMDWLGNGDHDNGAGREYTWWLTQKTTDAFRIAGKFEPPFSYERSVKYPEGHRNVVFPMRGVRTLPRLPPTDRDNVVAAPDTEMLYKYLKHFGGVCASHTSATSMGTDWRNNDPTVEPMVEIYQGDRQNYERPGAPRCPTADNSIGGWEPKGFVNLALMKGYRLAFECSSDHISTHISYANAYAEDNSPAALVKAMKERHIYGATDNIVADYRCQADGVDHMLGDEFTSSQPPKLTLRLVGTAPFAKVIMVKDDVEIPLPASQSEEVDLSWTDPSPTAGKTSYYYVRGEQTDGELVWVSPMWIKYQPAGTAAGQ